jgi:uroporphyrinogen-III synthase
VARAAAADAVAFTSSSTVERTVDLLGVDGIPPIVVSIGPVTSGAVRAAGLHVTTEADPHTLDGLAAALTDALA